MHYYQINGISYEFASMKEVWAAQRGDSDEEIETWAVIFSGIIPKLKYKKSE